MNPPSLAELVPLWRTLREEDVTALVTPSLDYVGGLELTPLDGRFASDDAIEAAGEGLRALVSSLDDGCVLHFLSRVALEAQADVEAYRAVGREAGLEDGVLRELVEGRATWLAGRPLRSTRLFLFFSRVDASIGPSRGLLGVRLPFASLGSSGSRARAAHVARLRALAALRNVLTARLAQSSLAARELAVDEVQWLHLQLLNPSLAARRGVAPPIEVRDTLWSDETVAREGAHLREYTEAEQLVREELQEERGHLRQGSVLRRALTLKVLPESGTAYFSAERLLSIAARGADGRSTPFSYWLATTLRVEPQARARFLLNAQHGLVDALRGALPLLADRSAARQAADAAKTGSIEALFAELQAMASKLVSLSVTVLLDGASLEELDARTEAARAAFASVGNSELLAEEISQLPAFLSVLPGAGAFQLRRKSCTSRNAGDFLPVFAPWRGSARPVSLLTGPLGDVLRFDPFDGQLSPAHHGLVVADTGSGKSVTLGALTLDALAAGIDAILVDNGGSWEPMTRLLGGVHLPVDISTPLTPFRSWEELAGNGGAAAPVGSGGASLDGEAIADVVSFLELCIREPGGPGFDRLSIQLVSRAVRHAYETSFRSRPDARPLMRDFRDALQAVGARASHPDDRRICEDVHRRLGLFVGDELFGPFLDRPSVLRFDARLITFDMAAVSRSPVARSIAMATVMTTITARAAARRRRTLVEVDEGHAYLGQDETAERFLERCYRVMRKYDVAMWMVSQQFGDFAKARSGEAIIGNSPIKLFLRHRSGHEAVADAFHFSSRARAAFRALDMHPGHFSDFLLLYGERMATVRLALHPLAYWLLTTDGEDKRLLARAAAARPELTRLELLRELARRHPHGAARGAPARAA